MKRVIVLVAALVLAATMVMGEVKDVKTIKGSVSFTLDAADSTGFQTLLTQAIGEQLSGSPPEYNNKKYSRIVGSCILGDLVPTNADSVAGEGKVDTLIINYNFVTDWYSIQAEADTGTLPCTTFFVIDDDSWADPTISIYGDSTAAVVTPTLTSDYASLLMDYMQVEYYCSDTAGTNGTGQGAMTGTIYYWFKFFEDE